jgi:hypothetical protein
MTVLRRLPAASGSALLAGLLAAVAGIAAPPLRAAPPSAAQLQALEAALNSPADGSLNAVLHAGKGLDPVRLEARRRKLRQQFPDLSWKVSPAAPLHNGQPTVAVKVSGTRRDGAIIYRLDAEQQLVLESHGSHIDGQTVLRERSLLRSGEQSPAVSVLIPDAVLTGQRYDVDVIFDDPLNGAITAGGIVALTPQQVAEMESPSMELGALGGGGLFKTVQAPLTPGTQTWAVLLVHPKGIISATKRVRVVADKADLNP